MFKGQRENINEGEEQEIEYGEIEDRNKGNLKKKELEEYRKIKIQ
jgi:hypothetical protein